MLRISSHVLFLSKLVFGSNQEHLRRTYYKIPRLGAVVHACNPG
jgi:hypothetical protein